MTKIADREVTEETIEAAARAAFVAFWTGAFDPSINFDLASGWKRADELTRRAWRRAANAAVVAFMGDDENCGPERRP
jgi:hypothetical protein